MKSFLSGRPSHQAPALRPTNGPLPDLPSGAKAGLQNAAGHSGSGHGPTVECVKQGDKIVRLVVTCTCGERIEVECLYPAGG